MIIVDAGLLYAYVDFDDQYHSTVHDFLTAYSGTLYVPVLVIPEVAYFIANRIGLHAEAQFVDDLASGDFSIEPVESVDWPRIAELVTQYLDLPLGTVDASVIALAERLGIRTIATFDLRHFTVVRPSHIEAFELVP